MLCYLLFYVSHRKKKYHQLDYSLKNSRTVWGLWFTGDRHRALLKKYRSIKKILLAAPYSPAFLKNVEISGGDKDKANTEIVSLTRDAIAQGIEVKWYSDFRDVAFTLYDPLEGSEPLSDKAYCVWQKLEPDVPRDERPLYIQKRTDEEAHFCVLLKRFKDIWNDNTQSRQPKPEEYK